MLEFPDQFPGTIIVRLEQSYRSAEAILQTANRVIAQTSEGYSKELWSARRNGQRPRLITCGDESEQDEMVTGSVLEHYEQGIRLRN